MNEIMTFKEYKLYLKEYFKFCVAIYAVYIGMMTLWIHGEQVLEWINDKVDSLVSKFKRREDLEVY